jgi:hypothetical protein
MIRRLFFLLSRPNKVGAVMALIREYQPQSESFLPK